jgi:hypothetical protein
VYFLDLVGTAAVIFGALGVASIASSRLAIVASVAVAALALSRGALFAHELAHQRSAVPGLRLAWHVLIGVPFLFPSFVYEHVHREHHRLAIYRTERDPEHAPDARPRWLRIVVNESAALAFPVVLLVRWALVTPFSFATPGARTWVWRRVSSLTLNARYVPRAKQTRPELLAELVCMLWSWTALVVLSPRALAAAAIALGVATAISDLRGDALHRFRDEPGLRDRAGGRQPPSGSRASRRNGRVFARTSLARGAQVKSFEGDGTDARNGDGVGGGDGWGGRGSGDGLRGGTRAGAVRDEARIEGGAGRADLRPQ